MKKLIIHNCCKILLLTLFPALIFAQTMKKDIDWKPFHFLIGEWVGEGTGKPGEGSGSFTFDFGLQKRVLIRKSVANYPPTKNAPAYSHDDLMIIYKLPANSIRAIYFDNEGHIINYSIKFSDDQNSLIFVSDIDSKTPHYRFTYKKINNQKLNFKFEIAPPGKPDEFSNYLEGTAHRK